MLGCLPNLEAEAGVGRGGVCAPFISFSVSCLPGLSHFTAPTKGSRDANEDSSKRDPGLQMDSRAPKEKSQGWDLKSEASNTGSGG